jgi:hypothetical protein
MDTTHLEEISATRRDVTVRWLVPDRVIFVAGEGEINSAVHTWMNTRIVYLMHSCATPKIHLISDMSRITYVPLSNLAKPNPVLRHPRLGWLISVGTSRNRVMALVFLLLARFMKFKYQTCDTLDEALISLQQLDPSLPDLRPYQSELAAAHESRS